MEVQSPAAMNKRHYDITMSRRTRKQSFPVQGNEKSTISVGNTAKDASLETKESDQNDHKSLKQLIIGDHGTDAMKCNNNDVVEGGGKGSRNSLGEHFNEEEKQLQLALVPKAQKDHNNLQGLQFKKLVRRYAKVLGHLMKAKRDPHLGEAGKKPIFKLSS